MPSKAYLNFLHIRIDVLKLIEAHNQRTQNRRGRPQLGYLTRSAVVMLCAAWERYNEDLLEECILYLSSHINDVNNLDINIKKSISSLIKLDRNELSPLTLAGEGWKSVWLLSAKKDTASLNTPKADPLKSLFKHHLGIHDYTQFWKPNTLSNINKFVSDRGEIAHNGNKASYITMTQLRKYQDLVVSNVIEIDSKMAIHLSSYTPNILPWQGLYSTDLEYYK